MSMDGGRLSKRSAERLLRVAAITETVDPKAFDLNEWKCGPVACAVGHAASDPWFRRRGLGLTPILDGGRMCLTFDGWEDLEAAQMFFGISYNATVALFTTEGYRSNRPRPTTVAKRIRQYVAARHPEGEG